MLQTWVGGKGVEQGSEGVWSQVYNLMGGGGKMLHEGGLAARSQGPLPASVNLQKGACGIF